MKHHFYLLLSLFMGICFTAISAPLEEENTTEPPKLTLSQSIQTGLANSSEIKRAMLSVKSADMDILSSWGEVVPQVLADLGYTRNIEVPVNFLPAIILDPSADPNTFIPVRFGTDNDWRGGFVVNQNIFRGEALVGISTSNLYKLAQKENYRAVAQQVVTQVRVAFYNVLIAKEQLEVQQAAITRLEKTLAENTSRAKTGLIDDYDVLRIQVQLKNEQPRLVQAQNALLARYRELAIAMGLNADFRFEVVGNLGVYNPLEKQQSVAVNTDIQAVDASTDLLIQDKPSLVGQDLGLRGDLRILRRRIELQDKRILADQSNFLPTVTAQYQYRWVAAQPGTPVFFGNENQRATFQTIGLNVSVPIFDKFKKYSTLQKSQIEKKDLQEQMIFAERNARNQLFSAVEEVTQALELIKPMSEGVRLAQIGYERAQSRYRNGVGSQLELTEAELQLRQAQLNYAQVVFGYLASKAQYDLAIGKVPFIDDVSIAAR